MKKATILVFALVIAISGSAFAQTQQILHISGHAWEDGGFPPSDVGDKLNVSFILNDIDAPLIWNTSLYAYTGLIADLTSVGEAVFNGTHIASYAGGTFGIYVDFLPSNHDYGINPPNATSPSTFTDGISTYLEGNFTDFTLTFNDGTASGGFNGTLNFTGGDVFGNLSSTEGWSFGANIAGVSPTGYDLQMNGDVFLATISVEDESWGGIKNLYR